MVHAQDTIHVHVRKIILVANVKHRFVMAYLQHQFLRKLALEMVLVFHQITVFVILAIMAPIAHILTVTIFTLVTVVLAVVMEPASVLIRATASKDGIHHLVRFQCVIISLPIRR